jgi:hypothetical protein
VAAFIWASTAAGIGFTVALFFATAAFPAGRLLDQTKLGALFSVGSGVVTAVVAVVLRVGPLRLRRGNVPYDENGLARLDQSELAARHFLDGRGIFTEPPCLLSQTRVLAAQAGNRSGEPFVLLSRAVHREQASLAHETIGDNHTGDEEQHDMNDPPVA